MSADCFGTDAEGENETFCHSSIRTNCRYSIPDKPDVSLSKNTLKYGESTEMYIKNLGSSGNTDIDHQEFKMNIPARLDIEKIKWSCILMGKKWRSKTENIFQKKQLPPLN